MYIAMEAHVVADGAISLNIAECSDLEVFTCYCAFTNRDAMAGHQIASKC